MLNILTIDLEDWFHILDHDTVRDPDVWSTYESRIERNTMKILDLLDQHNQKATFFVLGWVVRKYPKLLKEISGKGHDLGFHSANHELLYQYSRQQFRTEVGEGKDQLENLVGKPVNAYRAPGFSFNRTTAWLIDELATLNFKYDSSVFPVGRNHGGYPNFPSCSPCIVLTNGNALKEFPVSIYSIMGWKKFAAGGGYFRLMPFSILKKWFKNSAYNIVYVHPRDFDPGQPVLKDLPLKRKFMSYYGLHNSFHKFDRLLKEFSFMTVEKAAGMIDWDRVQKINLTNEFAK